jgi:hypothetical protein
MRALVSRQFEVSVDSPICLSVIEIEMLASSNDLFLFRMIQTSLKTRDQLLCVLLSMESVFTRRLLPTTPSRVKEGVDVGYARSISTQLSCVI